MCNPIQQICKKQPKYEDIESLINLGVEINEICNGKTALEILHENHLLEDIKCIKLLLDTGAYIEGIRQKCSHKICMNNEENCTRYYLRAGVRPEIFN